MFNDHRLLKQRALFNQESILVTEDSVRGCYINADQ